MDQRAETLVNSATISALHIHNGPAQAGRRVPFDLPPAAEGFYGRQTELQSLTARLTAGKNTVVVGPAGLGKTALAALAVRAVAGGSHAMLAASPFPDGIVLLDLYTLGAAQDQMLHALADKLKGRDFMTTSPAMERAQDACHALHMLLIIEGGEEADGQEGRADIYSLLNVLPATSTWLLLTRLSSQVTSASMAVQIRQNLEPVDAAQLFDFLSGSRVAPTPRKKVLELLDGHPLALTWAACLLARDEEDPEQLVAEWKHGRLPKLSDPASAGHTLEWLFGRSTRGLDTATLQVLAAAGLLAHAPFPTAAIVQSGITDDPDVACEALKTLVRRGLLLRTGDSWQFNHVLGYGYARRETGSDRALRRKLGKWLRHELDTRLSTDESGGTDLLSNAIGHMSALLRADSDQALWKLLAEQALYDMLSRLRELGQLGLAGMVLDAVDGWMNRIPAPEAEQLKWLRERTIFFNQRGAILRARGDLEGALADVKASLAIRQNLSAADPTSVNRQRDLSVSHQSIGAILRARGDQDGAKAAFEASLTIQENLAAADPSNMALQRDLGVSYSSIGGILQEQGNLLAAQAKFEASLAISKKLAAADAGNTLWQRDLGVDYSKVGRVLQAQGDLEGALAAFEAHLAITQKLAASDSANMTWRRDLGVSHSRIGEIREALDDLDGAREAYEADLAIAKQLAAADPMNMEWRRDLGVSHMNVGDTLQTQGDLTAALASFEDAMVILKTLTATDPSNALWQHDLSVGYNKIGIILNAQGDEVGALAAFAKAKAIRTERAAKAGKTAPG